MHEFVNRPGVTPHPAYSHGVIATGARTLYTAGQVGIRADGTVAEGIEAQVTTATENLLAVLGAAGMTKADIVKLTIFLTDQAHFPGFMNAAGPLLGSPPAAATLLIVKGLADPAYLVEIEAIAVR